VSVLEGDAQMAQHNWDQEATQNLSHLMGQSQAPKQWSVEEQKTAYIRLMQLPLSAIAQRVRGTEQSIAILSGQMNPPAVTFLDLLRHPKPPLQLLELVKTYAKAAFHTSQSVPISSSLMLYYLVLSVAYLRHDKKITSLGENVVKENLVDRLSEPWIDKGTAQLLTQALTKFQSVDDLLMDTESEDSGAFPAV